MNRYTVSYNNIDGAPCFVLTDLITRIEPQAAEDYCIVYLSDGTSFHAYTPAKKLRQDIEYSLAARE